jgi:hypothetical protein
LLAAELLAAELAAVTEAVVACRAEVEAVPVPVAAVATCGTARATSSVAALATVKRKRRETPLFISSLAITTKRKVVTGLNKTHIAPNVKIPSAHRRFRPPTP